MACNIDKLRCNYYIGDNAATQQNGGRHAQSNSARVHHTSHSGVIFCCSAELGRGMPMSLIAPAVNVRLKSVLIATDFSEASANFGILKWSTSAVCFGPPRHSKLLFWI